MSTPFRLLLPRRVYDEMVAHAGAELPNECCGLLAGRREGGVGQVERRYPLVNALASPTEYESEPLSLLAATKGMRESGLEELAVYHSHPTTDPVPSKKDRERGANWTHVVHIILSPRASGPLVRAWWLTGQSAEEAEWELTDDTPEGPAGG